MKSFTKLVLTLILVFSGLNSFSQVSSWIWARGTDGNGLQMGCTITTDYIGNVYFAGAFDSAITIGSTTLFNAGGGGVFLAKYDELGNFFWAKSGTGASYSLIRSISADSSRNVYVVGYFGNPSITFGSFTLPNSGPTDLFLAKYDSLGNVIWAKGVGGAFADEATSVATDISGNIYVTGYFTSPSITFGSTTLTNSGMFLAKYDSLGNVIWAKSAGSDFDGQAFSISTNNSGIFVTGYFDSDNATFGTTTLTNVGAIGSVTKDIFVVKYDALGNVVWANSFGGIDDDCSYSITSDATSIYIVGDYSSSNLSIGSTTLLNNGFSDTFIAKCDLLGNVIWAKGTGGTNYDHTYSVDSDPTGICITGGFQSASITFDSFILTKPVVGYTPMFVVKYDSLSNVICATAIESGGEGKSAVSSSTLGNAYIVSNHNKNPIIIGADTLVNAGSENVFIAKYYCDGGNGVNENKIENHLSIYPNPSSGKFTISNSDFLSSNKTKISVYDLIGNIVYENSMETESMSLDMSTFSKGVYILKMENGKGIRIEKIIYQ